MYEVCVKLFLESFDAKAQEIPPDFCPALQENASLFICALAKLGLSHMGLFFSLSKKKKANLYYPQHV